MASVKGKKGIIQLARDVYIEYNELEKTWKLLSKPNPRKRNDIVLQQNPDKKTLRVSMNCFYNPMHINKIFAKMAISLLPQDYQREYLDVYRNLNIIGEDIKENILHTLISHKRIEAPNVSPLP